MPIVNKITALITRRLNGRTHLLLFQHPTAGIQIPAGTVEAGEGLETAVLREVREETGLTAVSAPRRLGTADEILPADQRVIATPTQVYARPDLSSFAWASLRRGITVQALRHAPGFEQVEYVEYDQEPARHFITMRIRGWVPAETLAHARRRTFFHLTCLADTPARWTTFADNHTFTLFWAPLDALPPIVPPQAAWPAWLK